MRIGIPGGLLGLLVATTAVAQVRRAPNVQVVSGVTAGGVLPGQVTVALPLLSASLPRGSTTLSLRMVTLSAGAANQASLIPGRSNLVLAGDTGKYRVRYNFAFQHGVAAVPTTVSIHNGQLPSDPVVGQCAVTPAMPRCETIVDALGTWWLTATLDNGNAITFLNVTVAPTP